jgi:hypothetical protein
VCLRLTDSPVRGKWGEKLLHSYRYVADRANSDMAAERQQSLEKRH